MIVHAKPIWNVRTLGREVLDVNYSYASVRVGHFIQCSPVAWSRSFDSLAGCHDIALPSTEAKHNDKLCSRWQLT